MVKPDTFRQIHPHRSEIPCLAQLLRAPHQADSDNETVASSTDASPSLTSKSVHLPPISRVLYTGASVQNELNRIQCDTFDTHLEIHDINVGSLEESSEAKLPVNQIMDPLETSEGIIKRIAKPEYPIRVYGGPPTSITEEAQ